MLAERSSMYEAGSVEKLNVGAFVGSQIDPKIEENRTKINPKLKKLCPWGVLGGHGAQGRLQVAAGGKKHSPFGTLLAQNGRPEGHFRNPWKS